MNQDLILVDIDDKVIGYESKKVIHDKGLLHRAFSIFIYNGSKMLIQKRNKNKYHSGGLWSNACCSHPRKNETLEKSAHERLKQEMRFDTSLEEQFSFIYRKEFNNGIIEYEYDHVFLGEYSKKVNINLVEASDYKWIEIEELKKLLISKPEMFTCWFIISCPKIINLILSKENRS